MGNSLGGKKTTKVMRIDGETFKLKTPVKASEVLKNHPGLVLLESEAVKHYGIRAKPLEGHKDLQPKRLYFLVELPKECKVIPRRVHSGINMSAKDRLESLVLSRRSASDLTIMKQQCNNMQNGRVRLKMKLPKKEVEKLIQCSKNEAEVAEKIMELCMASNGGSDSKHEIEEIGEKMMVQEKFMMHWNHGKDSVGESSKAQKRVSFMPISEGVGPMVVVS
ncbi:hypothetical protein Lal_00024580 [Lupinus albus]|uniref:Uncharacterized protein n=1 Tax=Lupinus albus TaxID=3870 RepID=A0A6A5NS50_LUPAL|nr:hypothetical protein Lalb_Chr10g0096241 [Lupinus albus]KAF1889257.1 hypothetical protein Lal_00024580 [Lupinus albus]